MPYLAARVASVWGSDAAEFNPVSARRWQPSLARRKNPRDAPGPMASPHRGADGVRVPRVQRGPAHVPRVCAQRMPLTAPQHRARRRMHMALLEARIVLIHMLQVRVCLCMCV